MSGIPYKWDETKNLGVHDERHDGQKGQQWETPGGPGNEGNFRAKPRKAVTLSFRAGDVHKHASA